MNNNINNASIDSSIAFTHYGDDKSTASSVSSQALNEHQVVERGYARTNRRRDFSELQSNVAGTPGLTWDDYYWFRENEAVPSNPKGVMQLSLDVYKRISIVHQVINLMGDFAIEGIIPIHESPRIQTLYRNWWTRVQGTERSERYVNNLLKMGNVIVKRKTGKLTKKAQKRLTKSVAAADVRNFDTEDIQVGRGEIPVRYSFISPTVVDIIGGPLASFVGKKTYTIKLPTALRRLINSPKGPEKELVAQLPLEIRAAAKASGIGAVPLPSDKIIVDHYKKDDWEPWGSPLIECILDDIKTLIKLKLADRSALDGVISRTRVWKLGSMEHEIAANAAAFNKLAEVLETHVGGGTKDILWNDAISVWESDTGAHEFLSPEKYQSTLIAIYSGLGVPATLTGFFGNSGTTNNFIALKTFIRGLEYLRTKLVHFWQTEFALFQKGMGLAKPATLCFRHMDLEDENTFRQLLLDMVDRNILSEEAVQHELGMKPEVELMRLKREEQQRLTGKRPKKAGPYHESQQEFALKKIALNTGIVAPSEVGVDLDDKKQGEISMMEHRMQSLQQGVENNKNKPKPTGRPDGAKDSEQRTRDFKPKRKAILEVWARQALDTIGNIINPDILERFGKANMRSLSASEAMVAEEIKCGVLYHLEPFTIITDKVVGSILETKDISISPEILRYRGQAVNEFKKLMSRSPTVDEARQIQASIYTGFYYG